MIEVGSYSIHIYGLIIGIGILVGFLVAEKVRLEFVKRDISYKGFLAWDGLWWVVIPGIVLARMYHVIDYWEYYREHYMLIMQTWGGGMGIYGAIIGGTIGLWVYAKKRRIKLMILLDLAAFGLPIGQAIGRWGNYFNNELYGKPTDLPWGIPISITNRVSGFEKYTHFHPLFLYESLWSLFTFSVLYYLLRKKGNKLAIGSYILIYLIMYGFGRFWLEFLRIEPWSIGGVNVAQLVSLGFVVVSIASLFLRKIWDRIKI